MSMTIKDIHTHRPDAPRDALADIRVTGIVPDPARLTSAGLHPWDVTPDCREALDEVARLARHPLVAAIGECGIDRLAPVPLTLQTEAFVRQAEIADRCGKPLIIHAVRATADILALHRRLRPATVWIIHGFRGKPEAAAQLTRRGIHLSLGARFNPATARTIDPAMLLTETDESPIGIDAVRDAIAAARGITRAALDSIVDANAGDIFGPPAP